MQGKLNKNVTSFYTDIKQLNIGLINTLNWSILDLTRFILEALKLVLKNNHFVFKNFFHQIVGAAMGTIVALTNAALEMGYLENQYYERWKNEFGVNNGKYIEENWHRFLDDCYIVLD